jgi:hypothetical protein
MSPEQEEVLHRTMAETEGEATQRELAAALGVGSHHTAEKYRLQFYDRQTKRAKSLLSPSHMVERVAYSDAHFGTGKCGEAHADEKLFALGKGRKFRYVRHDTDEPCLQFVENQLHPPQLMVTAVVCRPDLAKGVNGKIALFRSGGYLYEAKKRSKNHEKGDVYWRDDTVDGQMYVKRFKEEAFSELSETARKLGLPEMKLQDDNAKPHVKAWEKLGLADDGLEYSPPIKRQKQPAKSPDLNVDDLYVWGVLQAGVNKRRPKNIEQLWSAIREAWEEDLTPAKLECAYRLLDPVMALLSANNGGNNFKLPHTGIRKEMRADGWDI